jgi:negative regulator of sigma-B (phosphoserine phosphatase)
MSARAFEWAAAAAAARSGQGVSGDSYVVEPAAAGLLVAVVDAIGHGPEAARVATRVIDIVREHRESSLISIMEICHAELRSTRGATMSLAQLAGSSQTMSWIGVGSVAVVLQRSHAEGCSGIEHLLVRSGVVGDRVPILMPSYVDFNPGDRLIMTTDGIRRDFADALPRGRDPAELARALLREFGSQADDALVLVIRRRSRGDAPGN